MQSTSRIGSGPVIDQCAVEKAERIKKYFEVFAQLKSTFPTATEIQDLEEVFKLYPAEDGSDGYEFDLVLEYSEVLFNDECILSIAIYNEVSGNNSLAVEHYIKLIKNGCDGSEIYKERCRNLITDYWDWAYFLEQTSHTGHGQPPSEQLKLLRELFNEYLEQLKTEAAEQKVDNTEKPLTFIAANWSSRAQDFLPIIQESPFSKSFMSKMQTRYGQDVKEIYSQMKSDCGNLVVLWTPEINSLGSDWELKIVKSNFINRIDSIFALVVESDAKEAINYFGLSRQNVKVAHGSYEGMLWIVSKILKMPSEKVMDDFLAKMKSCNELALPSQNLSK